MISTLNLEPDPYVIEKDNGFFRSLKEANSDPLSKFYEEREQKLSQLQEHYSNQSPFPSDDILLVKLQQEKQEVKKLLDSNLQKITLPSNRPHYGPGITIPNSVLVRDRIIHIYHQSFSYSFRLNYFGLMHHHQTNRNQKNGHQLLYLKDNYKQ
jgi:hypothetical protein